MLKPLLASLLLTAATVPGVSQTTTPAGHWRLASSGEGCMVHAASGQGTVLSIAASPEQGALLFIVQNRQLAALESGNQYEVEVEFDNMGAWQIDAVAQQELDRDGPGVIFAVRPGKEDGANFIKEFAAAQGMHIGRQGVKMDSLGLSGSRPAMAQMAQCMGKMMSNASETSEEEEPAFEGGGEPVKI